MKVIFLKDNPSGNRNQIKEVADGYALNYLLPQKIAVVATPEKIAKLGASPNPTEKKTENIDSDTKRIFNTIKNLKVSLTAKANQEGHLFGGISNEDIQKILKEKHGLNIGKETIELPHHLKEIGEHEVDIKINDNKTKLKVIIKAE